MLIVVMCVCDPQTKSQPVKSDAVKEAKDTTAKRKGTASGAWASYDNDNDDSDRFVPAPEYIHITLEVSSQCSVFGFFGCIKFASIGWFRTKFPLSLLWSDQQRA